MLSRVTAKNVGDVFFWDTLYIAIFPLLIAQKNLTKFWQNSPCSTANSWWQIGDKNYVIKLHQIQSNRENTITGRKTRSYSRETVLQSALILAKSLAISKTGNGRQYFTYGHYRSIFNHCDIIGLQSYRIRWKKCKLRAITPIKVIQGHRGRYQSRARIRLPSALIITDILSRNASELSHLIVEILDTLRFWAALMVALGNVRWSS